MSVGVRETRAEHGRPPAGLLQGLHRRWKEEPRRGQGARSWAGQGLWGGTVPLGPGASLTLLSAQHTPAFLQEAPRPPAAALGWCRALWPPPVPAPAHLLGPPVGGPLAWL